MFFRDAILHNIFPFMIVLYYLLLYVQPLCMEEFDVLVLALSNNAWISISEEFLDVLRRF